MKLTRITIFLLMMALVSTGVYGQLTIGYNLRSLFSSSNDASNLILKYSVPGTALAARLKLGYTGFNMTQEQAFRDKALYTNLDQWPSDIPIAGYSKSGTYNFAPGVEFRFHANELGFWYAGVDIGLGTSHTEQLYTWHSEFQSGSEPMFTVSNVVQYKSTQSSLVVSPNLLIGFHANITKRISAFAEASISTGWSKDQFTNSNKQYYWDGLALQFMKQELPIPFEQPEAKWNLNTNLAPSVSFYIAYTLGKLSGDM